MKKRYVGRRNGKAYVFESDTVPTQATHGHLYNSVTGPFRTKRAAILCAVTGGFNPHIHTVADAERIARKDGAR